MCLYKTCINRKWISAFPQLTKNSFQIKLPNISQRVCSCMKEVTILLNGGLCNIYMYIEEVFIILHVLLPFSFAYLLVWILKTLINIWFWCFKSCTRNKRSISMVTVVGKGAVQILQMTDHPLVVYISAHWLERIYMFMHTWTRYLKLGDIDVFFCLTFICMYMSRYLHLILYQIMIIIWSVAYKQIPLLILHLRMGWDFKIFQDSWPYHFIFCALLKQ